MRQFLSLTGLFLKHRLKNAIFWVNMAILLLLFGSFALLCPTARPASAQIGLMYDDTDSVFDTACEPLLASSALRFIYYRPESLSDMQRDVRSGVLHCAYRISGDAVPPITVYESEGAFLTPVTDELVFAAWFEAKLPQTTLDIATGLDLDNQQLILTEMQRLEAQSSPMAPVLTLNSATSTRETVDGMSLAPLLYAVLIPLFLLCCAFSALLAPAHEHALAALLRLHCPTHPHLPAAAAAFAQTVLFAAMPAFCEGLLLILKIETGYSPAARLVLIGALALLATLLLPAISGCRPNAALLLAIVLMAAVSVIFSGALITPENLGRFAVLKYLSPSWYLLRLMAALS